MRKLIIQIPCLNEEETLPATLAALPRRVPGFARVEWLVIDDGSTDGTAEVARANGVDHIVRLPRHSGLAAAFRAGLTAALAEGADVIVNTDADNQYHAGDIPRLVAPILKGEADLVVGCRPIGDIEHFSSVKRFLQKLGSWVVRVASGTDIPDAPSGFRAIGREAAMRTTVFSRYTYTLETLIQAGQSGLAVTWVPVRVNDPTRPSRLMKNVPSYVWHSLLTILRFFLHYKAFKFLSILGLTISLPGIALGLRFLYFFALGEGDGHVQSLILSALLISIGVVVAITGLIADLINVNRRLMEDLRYRVMRLERPSAEDGPEQATEPGERPHAQAGR